MDSESIVEEVGTEVALDIIEPGAGEVVRVIRRIPGQPPSLAALLFSLLSTMIAPIFAIFGILFAIGWAIDSDNRSKVDLSESETNSSEWMAAVRGYLITIPIAIIPLINMFTIIIGPGYAASYHQRPALKNGNVDYDTAARVGARTILLILLLLVHFIVYVVFCYWMDTYSKQ